MSIIDTVKDESAEATRRAAVDQITQTLKVAFVAAATNLVKGKAAKRGVAEFFESAMGDAVFKGSIGVILPALPKSMLGPVGPYLDVYTREVRVQGLTQGMVQVTNTVLVPMRAAITSLLTDQTFMDHLASLKEATPAAPPIAEDTRVGVTEKT